MSKDVAKVLCEWAYPHKRTAGIKISCPLSWNRKLKLLSLSLDSSFPQQNVPLEKVEISILFNYSLTYLLSTSSFWDVELSSINWVPWKVYYPCAGTAVQLGRVFLSASYAHVQWFVTIQKGERNYFVTPYRIAFLYRPLWWNFLDAKTASVERRFPQSWHWLWWQSCTQWPGRSPVACGGCVPWSGMLKLSAFKCCIHLHFARHAASLLPLFHHRVVESSVSLYKWQELLMPGC